MKAPRRYRSVGPDELSALGQPTDDIGIDSADVVDFDPPGTARDSALQDIEEHEQLAIVMRMMPAASTLRLDPTD